MSETQPPPAAARYPWQDAGVYLNHCGVAPLLPAGAAAARAWDDGQTRFGAGVFARLGDPTRALHDAAGGLLGVPPGDIAFTRNTAEGLCMVANGLPIEPGDRIISYVHEYPANHYPWVLQQARGARLELLPDRACGSGLPDGRPRGFELEDLRAMLGRGRARVVAVSHVQFASGFMADLAAIGQLCREHGAWLVVDAAQSLGVAPLRPAELGVDAVAASGWKWLLGPVGTGLLYTSPRLRAALRCTMAGADLMEQGEDYLNYAWRPHRDGRFFEYGTASMAAAAALAACLRELPLRRGVEPVAAAAARLRQVLIEALAPARFRRAGFAGAAGPIQSWLVEQPEAVARRAAAAGVTVTVRSGYLRTAPHGYQDEAEMRRAAEALNRAARAG